MSISEPITLGRAAALALEALEKRRAVFAPEANMHKLGGIATPATERARAQYDELTQAIERLRPLVAARRVPARPAVPRFMGAIDYAEYSQALDRYASALEALLGARVAE